MGVQRTNCYFFLRIVLERFSFLKKFSERGAATTAFIQSMIC
jgi:hypothetical protein